MSKSAVVDLGDEEFTADGTTHAFAAPNSALDDFDSEDRAQLIDNNDGTTRPAGSSNFLTLGFYQQFFDVDTEDVKSRILSASIPRPGKSFLADVLKGKPDLYGPFWICVTLVVSVAVTGNLASYFQTAWNGDGKEFEWHYDFHKVTMAATAVFSYAWLVPGGLYTFLWWTNTSGTGISNLSFLDLICLYGYSLVIYIPVSVLWLIQISALQWILVLLAAGLSGAVMSITLWPVLKENSTKASTVLMIVILGLHLLLACGFMLYFFHVPGGNSVAAELSNDGKVQGSDPAEGVKTKEKREESEEKKEESEEKKDGEVDKPPGEDKKEEEVEKEALKPLAQKVVAPSESKKVEPPKAAAPKKAKRSVRSA